MKYTGLKRFEGWNAYLIQKGQGMVRGDKGISYVFSFPNGRIISVVKNCHSIGNEKDLFEVDILSGEANGLCSDGPIGNLSNDEVVSFIETVAQFSA